MRGIPRQRSFKHDSCYLKDGSCVADLLVGLKYVVPISLENRPEVMSVIARAEKEAQDEMPMV